MEDKEKIINRVDVRLINMGHKPIYMDGVDVSECLFYQSNFEENYDVKIKHFCSNWHNSGESINKSNCYFKQLARKTQEREEIKEECEALKLENKELYRILADLKEDRKLKDKYKQECEELKERLVRTEEDLKYQCVDCMNCQSDRYRKALEEIEEYIKEYECDNCEDCAFGCVDCGTPRDILDIINKAKGSNNDI